MTGLAITESHNSFNYAKSLKSNKLKLDNKQYYIHAENSTTNNLTSIENDLLLELKEITLRNNSSNKSFEYLSIFIKDLDNLKVVPTIVPEPSGLLGLEWVSEGKNLILSIDEKGSLVYSYYSEEDEEGQQSGTLKFHNKIPKNIKLYIEEISNE